MTGRESCARAMHFCYGHRVMGHKGKCVNLHGHNGEVWIYVTRMHQQQGLDELGMVIDFSLLKERIGAWIDAHWDHTMILNKNDQETILALEKLPLDARQRPPFLLEGNPTAENLAKYLLWSVCPRVLQGLGVVVFKVEFWESFQSMAIEELDPFSPEVLALYK
ncbi:MAG: 6-carboxytetrahydropterin synthase [Oligoflexia bacterium]|nr:6-carboxytetrahydropterin synthase [Oligoflexia bacterium]MBF0364880.1 6-carboxytetrahydropterin synthase [Oligoflexia bacterium]